MDEQYDDSDVYEDAKRIAETDPEQAQELLHYHESLGAAYQMALRMYTGEPCRVCGRSLEMEDIRAGAVFVGYNADNSSRSAHRRCWEGFTELCEQLGVDWQTTVAEHHRKVRREYGYEE